MNPLNLAEKYMDCFYGKAPLDSMVDLLADDLVFQGPFHTFHSAKDYLESLKADPPLDASYRIVNVYENDNSVCLIYQFSKPGVETLVVQTFEIRGDRISKITLIFDTNAF